MGRVFVQSWYRQADFTGNTLQQCTLCPQAEGVWYIKQWGRRWEYLTTTWNKEL